MILCQLAFRVTGIVTETDCNTVLHTVGDLAVYTLLAPAELLAVIGRIADIDRVARRRLADRYVTRIEGR